MAFIVLNEEQLALLTGSQREQYEKDLSIYNERVAFVEQMEKLEGVEIESYEPKLQSIDVIDEIPEKEFTAPEYEIKSCGVIEKPEANFSAAKFEKPVNADVPKLSPIEKADIEHIKKVEVSSPELPDVEKANIAVKEFKAAEIDAPTLPRVAMPAVDADVSAKVPQNIEIEPVVALSVAVPDISVESFNAAESAEPDLPEIAVEFTHIPDVKKIETAATELPTVAKPEAAVNINFEKPAQAELPELSNIECANIKFTNPEIAEAKLPTIEKPAVIAAHEAVSVENSASELPSVNMPKINVKSFEKHELNKSELPSVEKVNAAKLNFKQVEKPEIDLDIEPISIAEIKPFEKVEGKATGLPDKVDVNVPDAYAILRELLSGKSDSDVLEEVNS